MKLFENGVGRPSNEIKKKRKIFIASAIILCIALVSVFAFTLTKVDTERLQGRSNGTHYMDLEASGSAFRVEGCKIKIPIEIFNTKKSEMKITGAYLKQTGSDASLSYQPLNKTLGAKTSYVQSLSFDATKIKLPTSASISFKIVIYFSVKGKDYYFYELANTDTQTLLKMRFCGEELECKTSSYEDKGCAVCSIGYSEKIEMKNKNGKVVKTIKGQTLNYCPNSDGVYTIVASNGQNTKSKNITVKASSSKEKTSAKKTTTTSKISGSPSSPSNSGSNNITSKKTTTSKLKSMKISCDKAVANKEFTCTVKNSSNKKLSNAKIQVSTKTDLAKNYKNSGNGSLKLKYTNAKTVKVTATLDGYKTKTVEVKIAKAPTTTTKKETSSLSSYDTSYVITKVTKKGDKGEKELNIKINDVGKNVKYIQYAVCFDRAACINSDEANYKAMNKISSVKKESSYKIDVNTLNPALLNQEFYIRVMTYDKNKKLIYWKVNHFYINPKTDEKSKNKNISDESKVVIGDYAGTTHDFLYSSKCDKVKSKYQANYRVPSVKKLSLLNIDKGIEKQYNVVMQDFGSNVKYVSFALCNKLEYCTNPNAIENISNDTSQGAVLLYQTPEHGKEFTIKTTGDVKVLDQKFYVRIYSYDANKKLMFSKVHEFTTRIKSKLGAKTDKEMKIGDRVKTDITGAHGSKKY